MPLHLHSYTYAYTQTHTQVCEQAAAAAADAAGTLSQLRVAFFCVRWGWVFLARTRILSRFQFAGHFIEFVLLETNQLVGSNPNVILTRQTYGQRSRKAAGSKHRRLAFYCSIRICYMFPLSKCRGESDLGLCTNSGLAKTMPVRVGIFQQIWWPHAFF